MLRVLVLTGFLFLDISNAGVLDVIPNIVKWTVKQDKKPLNYALRNQHHPKTGIKFTANGYPAFKKIDTCNMGLPWAERLYDKYTSSPQSVRQKHFSICSKKLYKKFAQGQLSKMKFTEHQIGQLKNGKTPDGFTWHHSEKKNILELVDRTVHNQTAHSGGYSLHH